MALREEKHEGWDERGPFTLLKFFGDEAEVRGKRKCYEGIARGRGDIQILPVEKSKDWLLVVYLRAGLDRKPRDEGWLHPSFRLYPAMKIC